MAAEVTPKGGTLEVGMIRPLFGPISPGSYTYDVTADGQRFVAMFSHEQKAGEPLTLIQNWTGLLKKLTVDETSQRGR